MGWVNFGTFGRVQTALWVRTCLIGDTNLSAAVVAAGHALACMRYSGGRYRQFETPAAKLRNRRAGYC